MGCKHMENPLEGEMFLHAGVRIICTPGLKTGPDKPEQRNCTVRSPHTKILVSRESPMNEKLLDGCTTLR